MLQILAECGHQAVVSHYLPFKQAAVRAGMVKYGKNCTIHNDEFGSNIKLSAIITDAELPCHDGSVEVSDCDDCTACVKACPSEALDGEYHVDDELCVKVPGWLRGSLAPREVRGKLRDLISSCSICQDVCPKNKDPKARDAFPFERLDIEDRPLLIELLKGSEKEMIQIIGPRVKSYGSERLRRNAAIACGNAGDPAVIPALIDLLATPHTGTRIAAAWALGKLGGAQALAALRELQLNEAEAEVLDEINIALEKEKSKN